MGRVHDLWPGQIEDFPNAHSESMQDCIVEMYGVDHNNLPPTGGGEGSCGKTGEPIGVMLHIIYWT